MKPLQPGDVITLPPRWQAGYPQSGNTWLCFILAGLCGRVPKTWQEGLIPNWDDVALGKKDAPIGWVRCHCKFADQFIGGVREAIYIVRHPLDVMLSSYRYQCQYHGCTSTVDTYIDRFIKYEGEPDNLQLSSGTWNENVESWMFRHPGIVSIRYEDLLSDPHGTISQVVGSNISNETICNAIDGATRERMMALDTQNFVGPQMDLCRWRLLMSEEQMAAAERAFGRVMEKIGYEL